MKLAPRFVLAFGLLVTVTTAGLGLVLREERRESETARFESEVRSACGRVEAEVSRQAESDGKLLSSACDSGELVDRTLLALFRHQNLDLGELRPPQTSPSVDRCIGGIDRQLIGVLPFGLHGGAVTNGHPPALHAQSTGGLADEDCAAHE